MVLDLWAVGTIANVVVSGAYMVIAATIFVGLARSGQLGNNMLGTATGGIFLTCSLGHGIHASHAILPLAGAEIQVGVAERVVLGEWHMWVVDGITAVVGIWYVTLRHRFAPLTQSPLMFEDVRLRTRQALEIHDNVVQGLVRAKLAIEMGRREESEAAMAEALRASQDIIEGILASVEPGTLRPGDFRRDRPSGEGPS